MCLQRLAGFGFFVVLFGAALAATSDASERPWVERVQRLILREAEALTAQGFQPVSRAMIEMTGRLDVRRFVLRLQKDEAYAFIGACDQDCSHATLEIYDEHRQLMSATQRRAGVVLLTGTPDQSGLYEVALAQPGCSERNCHTGFVVMQQGEPPAGPVIVATSKGLGRGPVVAGVTFGMVRRLGVELQAGNYRELQGVSITDCERQCLADGRCRAVEFYQERRSCGLFDALPPMRRARGIDASIKSSGTE